DQRGGRDCRRVHGEVPRQVPAGVPRVHCARADGVAARRLSALPGSASGSMLFPSRCEQGACFFPSSRERGACFFLLPASGSMLFSFSPRAGACFFPSPREREHAFFLLPASGEKVPKADEGRFSSRFRSRDLGAVRMAMAASNIATPAAPHPALRATFSPLAGRRET